MSMSMATIKSRIKRLLQGSALLERLVGWSRQRIGYSQFGEDLHIRSFYDRLAFERKIFVHDGCIVDVGAYRPIEFSNTYYFYRKGWHCINIDPTPGSMRIFNRTRPHDTNLELAIGAKNGSSTFYMFDDGPSVWNTLDAASARLTSRMIGVNPRQIEIQVRRLESILDAHLGEMPFEILSIDAEGLDLEILESNNFLKYRPRVILIEAHNISAKTLSGHPIIGFLSGIGYHLLSWINPNLLFIRDDSLLISLTSPLTKSVDSDSLV